MTYTRTGFSLISLLLPVLAACSHGRSDLLGEDDTAGGLDLPGIAARPNIIVDSTNMVKVFDEVTLEAYTAQWDAAMALARTQDLRLVNLRSQGDYSGYTLISGSAVLTSDSLINEYKMTVFFESFSITGNILLNGEVEITSRLWQVGQEWRFGHSLFNGALDFKGDWKGRIEYVNLLLPVRPSGELVSAESVFSDLDSVPSSFYPRGKLFFKTEKSEFEFTPFY